MTAPIVFLDVETTGLAPDDDVWEFAGIRRDETGGQQTLHLFVEHDRRKCATLPESFLADHRARFPGGHAHAISARWPGPPAGGCGWPDDEWHEGVASRREATDLIREFTGRACLDAATGVLGDRPSVIGCNVSFDTERLALLLRAHGHDPDWHYHLLDVEAMAVGWLAATARHRRLPPSTAPDLLAAGPPWRSDDLSIACDVQPPDNGVRHTAMGDAEWAMHWYDRIIWAPP